MLVTREQIKKELEQEAIKLFPIDTCGKRKEYVEYGLYLFDTDQLMTGDKLDKLIEELKNLPEPKKENVIVVDPMQWIIDLQKEEVK